MSLPNLPPFYDMVVTTKDGKFTADGQMFFDDLWQTLNELVRQVNNGFQLPQKTDSQIDDYGDDSSVPVGTLWWSTDSSAVKVKVDQPPAATLIRTLGYVPETKRMKTWVSLTF